MENASKKILDILPDHILGPENDALPQWDLTNIYASSTAPELERDLNYLNRSISRFRNHYKNQVKNLNLTALGRAVDDYFVILDVSLKIYDYCVLQESIHGDNPKAMAHFHTIEKNIENIEGKVNFFVQELERIPEYKLTRIRESTHLSAKHKYWLRSIAEAGYRLHPEADQTLRELNSILYSGDKDWEKITAKLPFVLNDKKCTFNEIASIMRNGATEDTRRDALQEYNRVLEEQSHIYEILFNKVIERSIILKKKRGFRNYDTEWNLNNEVMNDQIPRRVAGAIKEAGVEERYHALKAKMLGKDRLDATDISVTVGDEPSRYIPWAECRDIIVGAFTKFHPECGRIARKAFSENWIDAKPSAAKTKEYSYANPGSLEMHPHIYVRYRGTPYDVATVAHELGHALQMYLTKEKHGNFLSEMTSMTSECSATFAEDICLDEMMCRAKTPGERIHIQAQKIENTMDALWRMHQCEFAVRVHEGFAKRGEFTSDELDKEMTKSVRDSFGESLRDPEALKKSWISTSHFYYEPFYLGDYAMTNLIVRHLMDQYNEGKNMRFPEKIMNFLQKGGTELSPALLKRIGFDINKPDIWKKALTGVDRMITDLEKMVEEEKSAASHKEDELSFGHHQAAIIASRQNNTAKLQRGS